MFSNRETQTLVLGISPHTQPKTKGGKKEEGTSNSLDKMRRAAKRPVASMKLPHSVNTEMQVLSFVAG